jgi:N-acetylglucosamine-6-phosphate deacetylase
MDYVRPEVQVIRRCQAVLPDRVLRDACLRIEHGQIAALGPESPDMLAGANHVIDANGRMIGPGFVDVHCHGDGTRRFVDAPEAVALELLRQGTTTVLATATRTWSPTLWRSCTTSIRRSASGVVRAWRGFTSKVRTSTGNTAPRPREA